jgi:hypothetical protein
MFGTLRSIEVLLSSGTEADRKARLLTALVEGLGRAGTDANDIMVFFGEIDRASGSFSGGRLAHRSQATHDTFKRFALTGSLTRFTRLSPSWSWQRL